MAAWSAASCYTPLFQDAEHRDHSDERMTRALHEVVLDAALEEIIENIGRIFVHGCERFPSSILVAESDPVHQDLKGIQCGIKAYILYSLDSIALFGVYDMLQ
jgi:hypothetical protein